MKSCRISVDIDKDEHKYLKMCCAKLGVSIKDFVSKAVIDRVDAQEDIWWMEKKENQELLEKATKGDLEMDNFTYIDHDGTIHAI